MAVHLISCGRLISNELIKRRQSNLIMKNNRLSNKNLTANQQFDKNIMCHGIGCFNESKYIIILTAGTKTFTLKLCENCNKKIKTLK